MTALRVEAQAILDWAPKWTEEQHPKGSIYSKAEISGCNVLLAEIGASNVVSAQETERAITFFEPQIALFVGVAGGLKDVSLGDVVVASKIYAYESGSDKESFACRPDVGLSSYPVVQRARKIVRDGVWTQNGVAGNPDAFLGPVAAGHKVVKSANSETAKFLRANYGDALAVEMEGSGFIWAAYSSSVDALVVRGISDLLDGKELSDEEGWQQRASKNASAFAKQVLLSLFPSSSSNTITFEVAEVMAMLRKVVPELYPRGPEDRDIWRTAGGDLSRLELQGTGRAQWERAIRRIELGGEVTHRELIKTMLDDYPNNFTLQELRKMFGIDD